jgi:ankyrin repeat protein
MLIAHGADVNARSSSGTGVHIATDNGHLDVVRLLLAHGAEVDAKDYGGETALISAIRRGRTDIVLELLQQGADPNAKRRGTGHVSALEMAVSKRDALAVTALLAKGADLDQYGASALALAAKAGLTDIVQILVEGGVSADAADKWRRTALHHAVTAGRTDTVATLLAYGADVNAKDYLGRTALSLAAEAGQERMVELLLAHGADTNSRDNNGNTPLVYADLGAHRAIVQKLLPTDQSKDRPPVSLVFARERDGKCEIGLWNPYTAQAKQLLSLPTCPKHVFVADGYV